jgi:tetratricopeptide (TPR) repeat protein
MALDSYNQAIGQAPNNSEAYKNRGILKYRYLNDIPGAMADYTKSIELNPGYANAYYQRGLLKKRLKDLAGAIKDRQEANRLFKLQG